MILDMSILDVFLLALFLVLLQRVFDWVLDVLLSICERFLRPNRQVVDFQSSGVSEIRRSGDAIAHIPVGRKIYAVRRGFNPGLYYSWPECEREVRGFSNSDYRSFRSQADAELYLRRP